MTCYHPQKAVILPGRTENGKQIIKFVPNNITEYLYTGPRGEKWLLKEDKFIDLPCGKCIGCRLDYSRQWANRCMLEAQQFENNQFITLTYDNDHLKLNEGIDIETGELRKVASLHPEDLTKFIKDLRRYYKYHYGHEGIRFYACGEYGDQHKRPHFHILAFNLPVPDKEFYFTNKKGNLNYHSEIIQKIWGRGLTSICEVTWETCAYTARYIMKKIKGKQSKEIYNDMGIIPEFTRMSRDPGIGREYYEKNKKQIYKTDEIFLKIKDKVQTIKPARYYDKLYDLEEPEVMKAIKEQRRTIAENTMKLELEKTSLNKEEYLNLKETKKREQAKKLTRHMENDI